MAKPRLGTQAQRILAQLASDAAHSRLILLSTLPKNADSDRAFHSARASVLEGAVRTSLHLISHQYDWASAQAHSMVEARMAYLKTCFPEDY